MTDKTDLYDLISLANDHKPLEFGEKFAELMTDRIESLIDDKKQELAQSLFSNVEVEDEDEDSEVDETEETETE